MEPTSIGGAWTFSLAVHRDDRGHFLEWFRAGELSESLGYWPQTAQANCSVSRRGVIRGVHFATVPPGQAKYVTCVSGAILDVIVDIRVGSPDYGRWEAVRLDDTSQRAVFLEAGLGHAFTALSEEATVIYLCSTPYSPGREHGVHPLDPGLGPPHPGHGHGGPGQSRAGALAEGRRGPDARAGPPGRSAACLRRLPGLPRQPAPGGRGPELAHRNSLSRSR